MHTLIKIALLLTVTLSAQSHHVGILNSSSVSQLERIVVVRIVARQAAYIAVGNGEAGVEFIQVGCQSVFEIGLTSCVAG